jgi:hypothetical protein
MKISMRYGSHLPVLLKLVNETKGPILELGVGLYSTPLLHFACLPTNRKITSLESDKAWFQNFKDARTEFHDVQIIEDWDKYEFNGNWDIAFIDHGPDSRRHIEAMRLANKAKYIILHDSDPENDNLYKFSKIYPMFKYRFDYTLCKPNTTVVSNTIDVTKLTI